MTDLRITKGLVITESQDDELVVGGKRLFVVPAWRWAIDTGKPSTA
jgi:hypothetical protein